MKNNRSILYRNVEIKFITTFGLIILVLFFFAWTPLIGQQKKNNKNKVVDNSQYESLHYRLIGPSRGGRVSVVTGTRFKPNTFYMGSTGGVWKTTDNGEVWRNISDGYFSVGSIGAVTVAPSDPSVIYVGTGEAAPRGDVSVGKGVYRSSDSGKSWQFIGLPKAGQIGDIVVDPENKNLVYVAALGHIFGPNKQRGVFRSQNGGKTWEKVLFVSDSTGAEDLAIKPDNPNVIYASLWRAERKPWTMISGGGPGDGLYKSTDGGDSWEKLTNGLPSGTVGRIGVAVSPANPDRVWALVEAKNKEGLYRSDNGGKDFKAINLKRKKLLARAWYYTRIVADPNDENTVYILNEDFYKSVDGGKTFNVISTPHGDNHDLWINPDNSKKMVQGNDGGANVSVNGGKSWSTQLNQPTAEFYSLAVDDQFPYRIYAPQQDNSTISIPSRTSGGLTPYQHWYSVGGGETGPIAVKPGNPDIVYAGSKSRLDEWNKKTGQARQIAPYPQAQHGQAERDLKYRFQWNSPVITSTHNPDIIYLGSQYLHKTTNGGQSWNIISPDLTRNDPAKQGYAGGPIRHDITGVEIFDTIFAIGESSHNANTIWVGSNDGLVHITRNNGKSWEDITPDQLPKWTTINRIEVSPQHSGKAYVVAYRYRYDDFSPYILMTEDYGKSWELLTNGKNGIPSDYPTRVVREDPKKTGLLYAGTEFGLFVSFDDGDHWQSLQLNLPQVPINDLKVHRNDLVVATQGRSLWILDDLNILRQQNEQVALKDHYLYQPAVAYRFPESRRRGGMRWEENPPNGVTFHYYMKEKPNDEVTIEILDTNNNVIRKYPDSSKTEETSEQHKVPAKAGANRFTWDFRYAGPEIAEKDRLTDDDDIPMGTLAAPRVAPGTYKVRLSIGKWTQTRSFEVKKDPRVKTTKQAFQKQVDLALDIRDAVSETSDLLRTIRSLREHQHSDSINSKLTVLENKLIQPKAGDQANLVPKMMSKLGVLNSTVLSADARPTDSSYTLFNDLKNELENYKDQLNELR